LKTFVEYANNVGGYKQEEDVPMDTHFTGATVTLNQLIVRIAKPGQLEPRHLEPKTFGGVTRLSIYTIKKSLGSNCPATVFCDKIVSNKQINLGLCLWNVRV
jgi:hypothetical protein